MVTWPTIARALSVANKLKDLYCVSVKKGCKTSHLYFCAQILSEWFGRTIIRTCARLSYEDAFDLLSSSTDKQNEAKARFEIHSPFSLDNVRRSILYLNRVSEQQVQFCLDSAFYQ